LSEETATHGIGRVARRKKHLSMASLDRKNKLQEKKECGKTRRIQSISVHSPGWDANGHKTLLPEAGHGWDGYTWSLKKSRGGEGGAVMTLTLETIGSTSIKGGKCREHAEE